MNKLINLIEDILERKEDFKVTYIPRHTTSGEYSIDLKLPEKSYIDNHLEFLSYYKKYENDFHIIITNDEDGEYLIFYIKEKDL